MSTTFQALPLSEYLKPGAGKLRRVLHDEAFERRIAHWKYSACSSGLDDATATVQKRFGAALDDLEHALSEAQLQYDIQLEIVLALEDRMHATQDEHLLARLGQEVCATSCDLADYEVALLRARQRVRGAKAVLGSRQAKSEDCYAQLLEMDEVVQLRETVREQLDRKRSIEAESILSRIGSKPARQLRQETIDADLGNHEKAVLQAIAIHEGFKKKASLAARQIAQAMNRGNCAYLDEAPRESHSFRSHGSSVRSLDKQGNTVARWAVAADGSAYLLRIMQPRGTRRIQRHGTEVRALDKKGRVLGRYPNTAWLMRSPQRKQRTDMSPSQKIGTHAISA